MTWRETIQDGGDATFRGVPFKTTDAEIQGGRRTVVHEYPDRDTPYPEDMGKRAKQFRVDGYVIGDDYLDQRDELIQALEEEGPGELRHPRYGVLQVSVVGSVSVKESNREGGMARFSIDFVEAGENVFPGSRANTVDEVDQAAGDCEDEAEEIFGGAFDLSGPSTVLNSAIEAVQGTVGNLAGIVQQVTSLDGLSDLVRSVTSLAGDVPSLIATPDVLGAQIGGIFDGIVDNARRPLAALQQLQALAEINVRPTTIARAGSTAARIISNQSAQNDLVRVLSLGAQARLVSIAITGGISQDTTGLEEKPIATAAQALTLRDAVLDQIDDELETTEPAPALASSLQTLRAAVSRDVTARAELLRERSTFTPMAALPALVLAHRVYGDATRAEELLGRNGLSNPNCVPAAPLEILQ